MIMFCGYIVIEIPDGPVRSDHELINLELVLGFFSQNVIEHFSLEQ